MANEKLREQIKKMGIPHWKIAEKIGISEFTFCRWLRRDLSENLKSKVLQAIKELTEE